LAAHALQERCDRLVGSCLLKAGILCVDSLENLCCVHALL
jgi:hypothetical protein